MYVRIPMVASLSMLLSCILCVPAALGDFTASCDGWTATTRDLVSLQATDKTMQQRVAVALAWLGKEADLRQSFVDRRGLDVLLELLTDQRRDASSHKDAAGEFC